MGTPTPGLRSADLRNRPVTLGAIAFVGGIVAGTVIWGQVVRRSQRDLFAAAPLRRLAALGYLAGHPGPETARLLTEYVAWEQQPLLRRRGRLLLDRMSPYLD
ncbi:MAG: hypothetical protein H0X64_09120 [Gemmatimonadaceae bacterium]|nr:hypothetical protein [Gemmatimonadaceae bacterium]